MNRQEYYKIMNEYNEIPHINEYKAELTPLLNFIRNHTKLSFKDLSTNLSICGEFQYEGKKSSIEGWTIKRTDEIGKSIDIVILMLINDITNNAFLIYQRDQKIENILK